MINGSFINLETEAYALREGLCALLECQTLQLKMIKNLDTLVTLSLCLTLSVTYLMYINLDKRLEKIENSTRKPTE